tara:strand:+ start:1849 stop:2583 length:735 start_codon:yes stop_codon:yes gene_type:complete
MKTTKILETNITETTISDVSKTLTSSKNNQVAICNANTLVRSVRNKEIREAINSFSIKTPDGFPVAKALSFLTKKKFLRVDGYKVFLQTISDGLEDNISHYFFGNNESTTIQMIENLKAMFPNIEISGYICPENLSAEELAKKYNYIFEDLKVDIVWVSLGFPKQELFIQKVYKEIGPDINFVGVGGVFEWVAGTKKKAPEWIANIGLEWVLRLVQDPKRLYKRYLIDNTLFVLYFLRQVLFRR